MPTSAVAQPPPACRRPWYNGPLPQTSTSPGNKGHPGPGTLRSSGTALDSTPWAKGAITHHPGSTSLACLNDFGTSDHGPRLFFTALQGHHRPSSPSSPTSTTRDEGRGPRAPPRSWRHDHPRRPRRRRSRVLGRRGRPQEQQRDAVDGTGRDMAPVHPVACPCKLSRSGVSCDGQTGVAGGSSRRPFAQRNAPRERIRSPGERRTAPSTTDMIQHPTERKLRPPPPRHARQSLAPSSARSCQARVVLVA